MSDQNVHAAVARSTLRSKYVKNTWCPEQFWQLSRWKRAHGYGTKHISKSKCEKTPEVGSSFSTWALKKECTMLRRANERTCRWKGLAGELLQQCAMGFDKCSISDLFQPRFFPAKSKLCCYQTSQLNCEKPWFGLIHVLVYCRKLQVQRWSWNLRSCMYAGPKPSA